MRFAAWAVAVAVAGGAISAGVAGMGTAAEAAAANPFRLEAVGARLKPGGQGVVQVVLRVPAGHHVYRDMLRVDVVDAAGLTVGPPSFPPGLRVPDPANPAAERELYDMDVIIDLPVGAGRGDGARELRVEVGYQGCRKSLCFMPQTEVLAVPVTVGGAAALPAGLGRGVDLVSTVGGSAAPPAPSRDWSFLPAEAMVRSVDPQGKPHPVVARLVAESTSLRAGDVARVALHLEQAAGWHTYWKSPGDIGLPTSIQWTLPDGWSAAPHRYPTPARFDVQSIISYGYDHEVLLISELAVPATAAPGAAVLRARADWLVCEVVCIPGGADLALPVEVRAADAPAPEPGPAASLFAETAARHPVPALSIPGVAIETALSASAVRPEEPFRFAVRVAPVDGKALGFDAGPGGWPAFAPIVAGSFFVSGRTVERTPDGALLVTVSAETYAADPLPTADRVGALLQFTVDGTPYVTEVEVPLAWAAPGSPVAASESPLLAGDGSAASAAPATGAEGAPAPAEASSPALYVLLAFFGGALLNIMPCVLPVLTLKLYSLVGNREASAAVHRKAGLAYTGGILVSFAVLAAAVAVLKGAFGLSVGWGFQFQYPGYVAALALTVFVFGLSLFGVFEIPAVGANQAAEASQKDGIAGYFLTGVFTTLLATPCSAPFLGTAMGFAFGLPAWGVFAFFLVAGLGLASPFLVIAFAPVLIRFLPRPGPWMETFKHLMGFSLMATLVWLLTVMGAHVGLDGLGGFLGFLVVVAVGAWAFGRFGGPTEGIGRQLAALAGAVALSVAGWFLLVDLAPSPVGASAAVEASDGPLDFADSVPWQPFDEARIAASAGQQAIFIDFTADWCLTCKANEKTILETDAVRGAFAEAGILPLKADWTRRDETITRWLMKYGRAGVPFYLVIPKDPSQAPIPLPEVITPGLVIDAVQRAKGG